MNYINEIQSAFYVSFPKNLEVETNELLQKICNKLQINYDLWSYSDIKDENEHFLNVVTPAIENAKFVLFFVANDSSKDFLVAETYRLCSNLNKRVIPIKIGNSNVKGFEFRSDVLDYDKEDDRKVLIEQMHGLLGLRKTGDIYGANVTLSADLPCEVSRYGEIIGNITPDKNLKCILAKGTGSLKFKFGENWNRYGYEIKDNDCSTKFKATLMCTKNLSSISKTPNTFDINRNLPSEWFSDITNRDDFELVSTSQDAKKRKLIVDSYNNYYANNIRHYKAINEKPNKEYVKLGVVLLIMCIITGFVLVGYVEGGLFLSLLIFLGTAVSYCIVFALIIAVGVKINESANKLRQKQIDEEIDVENDKLWETMNIMMNENLSKFNLERQKLYRITPPRDSQNS